MSFLWGSTELKVVKDSYMPPYSEVTLNETKLIPNPSDLTAVNTALQQGGRGRSRIDLTAQVSTYAEYLAFIADRNSGTQRTFTGADGYTGTMMLESVSKATRKLYPLRFEFSLTLVEV